MNNELNQGRRAKAVSLFLANDQKTYLDMIYKTQKMLGNFLGFDDSIPSLAEGIMHEIFGDIIDGTRAWDKDKWKLEQVLWKNIFSEVSARVKKEKRYVLSPDCDDGDSEGAIKSINNLINTPPEDIEGNIDAETIEEFCRDKILIDDEDAQIVFNEMLTGKKQKQIADYLGITVEVVENTIRNIRRKIAKQIPFYLIENLPIDLKDKILKQT